MKVGLSRLLELTLSTPAQPLDPGTVVELSALRELATSGPGDVAFLFNKEYASGLATGRPGVLVVGAAFVEPLRAQAPWLFGSCLVLVSKDPYLGLARTTEFFAPLQDPTQRYSSPEQGSAPWIHPTACVELGAVLGPGSWVGPHCWVSAHASLGARAWLAANVSIYPNVRVGDDFRAHAGAVLGSDGFGYSSTRSLGSGGPLHQKIHHLGGVRVGNRVEIGANSCIDRGTLGDTVVGDDTKIDNLCHVGHNAQLGRGVILCGGVLLAGRAVLQDQVVVGGNTGIDNAVVIGEGAQIGALALVTRDVPPGGTAVGNPQRTVKQHMQINAQLNRQNRQRSTHERLSSELGSD